MQKRNLGAPDRGAGEVEAGRVDGMGAGRKEQVLRSWKILKTERWFTTPFPPGTRPGGGGSMCVALPPTHVGGYTLYVRPSYDRRSFYVSG